MAGDLEPAADAAAHLPLVLAERQQPHRHARGEPAAARGGRAAGVRVPAAPAAGAHGADRGGAVRGASAASRSGGLYLGPQHRAGGGILFRIAAVLAHGAALDGGGSFRGGPAGEGGGGGVSTAS